MTEDQRGYGFAYARWACLMNKNTDGFTYFILWRVLQK